MDGVDRVAARVMQHFPEQATMAWYLGEWVLFLLLFDECTDEYNDRRRAELRGNYFSDVLCCFYPWPYETA